MAAFEAMPFKLGFREEGDFVNCYFMSIPAKDDAPILLGSLRLTMVKFDRRVWDDWKELMKRAFKAHVKNVTGVEPIMPERPAPDDERSGSA